MPADLVEGHGFPPLDAQAKRLVLGENLARLHDLDPADVPQDDVFTQQRAQDPAPWSRLRREGADR